MHRTPEEYAAYLSRKRDALAHFKQTAEIPHLPNATADAHRKLVIAAFLNANGDTADGRWTHLAHLCRLATTRGGYRWLNTRVERRTHGGRGRSITRVDSKCLNIEKKQAEESCLIQKVESWKQTMTREMANDFAQGSNFHTSQARQTSLGFKVAKRPALTKSSGRHRTDLQTSNPESSFLPPSFPSHLAASTPQPGRRKPPHISFSSPLIFSGNVQAGDGTNTPVTKAGVRRSFTGHNFVPSAVARPPSSTGTKTQHNMSPPSYMDSLENHVSGSLADKQRASEVEDLNAEPKSQVHFFNLLDANGDDFNPPFTSTQKAVGLGGMTLSRTGHDSHFDVAQRVEEVTKLLLEDVGLYR
ncbi:hypothetical protein APHAL10511_007190 [Amanita phalloides]|nr:hypothetical protein APHAL10511_007190 [Amanita phalloides]